MYPYKEEIITSIRAFIFAWALIIIPIMGIAGMTHVFNNIYGSEQATTH